MAALRVSQSEDQASVVVDLEASVEEGQACGNATFRNVQGTFLSFYKEVLGSAF
jgi:hypothetical protein